MNKYILIIAVFMYSCTRKETRNDQLVPVEDNYINNFENKDMLNKLANKVLLEGDTIAFLELSDIYLYSEHEHELLYYSIIMSENYNFHEASNINYMILHNDFITVKNEKNNKIANYYLLKSYEQGHKSALNIIKQRFPNSTIPKSSEYWDEIN